MDQALACRKELGGINKQRLVVDGRWVSGLVGDMMNDGVGRESMSAAKGRLQNAGAAS